MKPKILVVSYFFPPFPRVGGRRLAKFCKYLDRLGYDVAVVAGAFEGTSSWDKDIVSIKNKIQRVELIKPKVPYYKKKLPTNFLEKVVWKMSHLYHSFVNKFKHGNYQDPSYLDRVNFDKVILQEINNNDYTHLFISGGPYRYLEIIKNKELKGIKKIVDLRDNWTSFSEVLSTKQRKQEKELEMEVLSYADAITCSEKSFMQKYMHFKNVHHIPHAIDFEDLANVKRQEESDLRVIFGGDFYGAKKEILRLDKFASKVKSLKPEIVFEFYSTLYEAIKPEFDCKYVELKKPIPLKEYLPKIMNSCANIYIRTEEWKHFFSTKFYELLYSRKPILYFGPTSDVSDLVLKSAIGYHITDENIDSMAKLFVSNFEAKLIPKEYDINKHSFENETKKLAKIIDGLNEA